MRLTPRSSRWVITAVLFSVVGTSSAPAWSLDLMQAYQAALEQDPKIRAARAARDAAAERLPQARSQLLPNVSANLGRYDNNVDVTQQNALGRDVTSSDRYFSYNQTLQLRQPLFRKPLMDGLRQANSVVADAQATLDSELQDVGSRVAAAYLEALLAQDALELARKKKEVTTIQLDAARKSLAAGSGTRTDIDEAQARLDMDEANVLSARQQVDLTTRQLEVLTHQPATDLARVDTQRVELMPPQPAYLQYWVQQAEDNSPEIRALKARVETAQAEIDKAEGAHYPTVDAIAQITRSGSENINFPRSKNTNRMVGIQISVPLFSGGYVTSTVRQAIAEHVRTKENLEAVRRDLAVRVHREYRGVTEGVLKVRALEQAVKSGNQLVTSSRRSFEVGSRTMVDVLNAEQQLQIAQRDLAEARYVYLASRVRLNALVGNPIDDTVRQVNAWLIASPQ